MFPVSTGGSPGHHVCGPSGGTSAWAMPLDSAVPAIARLADSNVPATSRVLLCVVRIGAFSFDLAAQRAPAER